MRISLLPEPIVVEHWLLRVGSMMGLFVQGCGWKNQGDCEDQVHDAMAAGAGTHKPGKIKWPTINCLIHFYKRTNPKLKGTKFNQNEIKDSLSVFSIRWLHLWIEMAGSESALLNRLTIVLLTVSIPHDCCCWGRFYIWSSWGRWMLLWLRWSGYSLIYNNLLDPFRIFRCRCSCIVEPYEWLELSRIQQQQVCLWWKWKMLNLVFYELLSECN